MLFDRALTEAEMDDIMIAIDDAYEAPGVNPAHAAATCFYRIAARSLGFESIDAMADAQPGGTFKATDFTIAEAQWHAVGETLVAADRARRAKDPSAIERINLLMDWMNVGPSARVMESAHG